MSQEKIKEIVESCRQQGNLSLRLGVSPSDTTLLREGFLGSAWIHKVPETELDVYQTSVKNPEYEIRTSTLFPYPRETDSANTLERLYERSEKQQQKPYQDIQLESAGAQLGWYSGLACVVEELGITYTTSDGREWAWDSQNNVPAAFSPVDTPHITGENASHKR